MLTDTDELAYAGTARQAELLRAGEIAAPELTELHLDRIDRLDGELNAFRIVRAERALEEARMAQERLRAAGAVIVGQTNMPELALWPQLTESQAFGATRNPWDRDRSPGGSSAAARRRSPPASSPVRWARTAAARSASLPPRAGCSA